MLLTVHCVIYIIDWLHFNHQFFLNQLIKFAPLWVAFIKFPTIVTQEAQGCNNKNEIGEGGPLGNSLNNSLIVHFDYIHSHRH